MPIYPYSFQLPPLNVQDIPNDGAVGEFLGISAGGVLDWLPVASGGGDMLKSENLSGLASYPTARTNLGLGTTDTPTFKNLVISTGSIATSAPVTISQTWADVAQTFKALVVNAAGTSAANSASGSLLLDLQVGGVSQFKVDKTGNLTTTGTSITTASNGTWGTPSAIEVVSGGHIRWASRGRLYSQTADSISILDSSATLAATLAVEATNTLALRNGAAAQTFNVYGTYSSITDYRRLSISVDQTTGNASILANKGSGTTGNVGQVFINGVTVGVRGGFGIAIGENVLPVVTGIQNLAVGFNALQTLLSGTFNCAIGNNTLTQVTTGGNNIAFGSAAGTAAGNASNSVFLGTDTKALGAGQTNQIVIGYDATGLGSNTAVLGNSSITTTALRGNVGIGTTAPAEKLHVLGGKVLVGDPTDTTGAAVTGDLTVAAWRAPQLNLTCNTNSSSFFGVNLKAASTLLGGILANSQSGEVKLGAFSGSGYFPTFYSNNVEAMRISTAGNVGIGTVVPSTKLHIEDAISPTLTVKNTSVTGYSQVLLANTVVPGSGFWVNGSAQLNYGGASSFNIYAAASNIAFHTASVTNALSIAQSGAITYTSSVLSASGSSGTLGSTGVERTYINQNGARIFGFDSGLFLLGAAYSSANPAIKRNGTELQARLADDLAFTFIQGKIKTDTAYTGTTVVPTGFITLYDSTGTAYKVPCVAA